MVDIDIVLVLRVPVLSMPNFITLFRERLNLFPLPYTVTETLKVIDVNFTTGCYPNNGSLQCHCEENYAWSCNKCINACNNVTGPTCGCINGLPTDGEFCEPITKITPCRPTDSVTSTTLSTTTTSTTATSTTTTSTTSTTPTLTTTTSTTTTLTTTTLTTPTSTTTTSTTPTPTTATSTTPTSTTPTPTTPTSTTTTSTTTTPTTPTSTTATSTPATSTTPTPTTTTSTTTTSTTTTSTTPPTEERTLEFGMDMEFKSSFNNPENTVYINTKKAIQEQCAENIQGFKSVKLNGFRSGSTIAEYTISASSFQETEIEAVKNGIFTQLSKIYAMIIDSQMKLKFEPSEEFVGKKVKVTCGPPPEIFGTDWDTVWKRNDEIINEDTEHEFSKQDEDGAAILTMPRVFNTDNGVYKCQLKSRSSGSVFRQTSGTFTVKTIPVIKVSPIRKTVDCRTEKVVVLSCSINSPYEVTFIGRDTGPGNSITNEFSTEVCENGEHEITCQEKNYPEFKKVITLRFSTEEFACVDDEFGNGFEADEGLAPCDQDKVGNKTAVCRDGEWQDRQDNCVLGPVQDLLDQSEFLNNNSLPEFLQQLRNVTVNFTTEVVDSPANINAIVSILINVANAAASGIQINRILMEDILFTAGVLTTDGAKDSWNTLNNQSNEISETRSSRNVSKSVSSSLLQSLETITTSLSDDSFVIDADFILLNKTTFTERFNLDFNSSVKIDIPGPDGSGEKNLGITMMVFASLDNVLPAKDKKNSGIFDINGRVLLVQSNATINNVSFTFDILNDTLQNPQCVFWNFSLFEGQGGWDDEGCELEFSVNETVVCNCNHLTSFSILMSPYVPNSEDLDIITYFGVGISMASLVICLIIEGVIWKKIRRNNTSYLRHVSIVNIAVSLLIANIWFIIGAAISNAEDENVSACSAATFFIHFFYLALFFWMLASALLLIYRTVSVFDGGLSKKAMLAIGFSLGYGAPLIIAIITIAVTAPSEEYIRGTGVCWLNWDQSKALLAFVIPALLIVLINLIILLVVIYKMLRRRAVGDAAQAAERHVLVVIARSLAVLTPFFGLTWSLGVGTMTDPTNKGIHIAFAFFNSLQGFFILVFGTLLDKKVRSEIAVKSQISSGTKSTSAGNSSTSGLGIFRNRRRERRDGYNISSSGSGEALSFSNT